MIVLPGRKRGRPSCKPKLRTWEQIERTLERLAIPEFRDRPVKEIRRRDIVNLLEKVAIKTPGQSNHLRAYLSKMFNWLLEREVVDVNPVIGVTAQHKPQARTRILTDAEVNALWKTTERMSGAFGDCIRLLLLTGMRRDEAGKLHWDEIRDGWAELPASRMKAGRDYRAPLSTAALAILEGVPRFAGCPFVFTTGGKVPINGWGKTKGNRLAPFARSTRNLPYREIRRLRDKAKRMCEDSAQA